MSHSIVQSLEAHKIPLEGVHLIEASAGTGKTFNITRIYLRLLLERKLKVQNLLVVTFTKAATEELKGRIDAELREALAKWGSRGSEDEFYQSLESAVSKEEASILLRSAIGDLDEASIFTIHGFCKRVLSQHAFESGLPFDLEMEVDSVELKLEAVKDWYRRLEASSDDFLAVTTYYPTPDTFTDTFKSLLGNVSAAEGQVTGVEGNSPERVTRLYLCNKTKACDLITQHTELVFSELITSHKDKAAREEEYHQLIEWLNSPDLGPMPKAAAAVFDGKRYSRKQAEVKAELNRVFQPLKDLKKQAASLGSEIDRAKTDSIITHAFPYINNAINERKKQTAVMDFDDLVSSLQQSLSSDMGDVLAKQLATQYPVALVDEFQDTDPNQYAIFNQIYSQADGDGDGDGTQNLPTALYMIGDPKQAIYGFRGGDVFAYLTARDHSDRQWYMDTNWRSSSLMIEAYNRIFYGKPTSTAQLEVEQTTHVFNYGIGYIPVKSAPQADKSSLSTMFGKPLKYIYFEDDDRYGKNANNQQFRAVIADWCGAEIDRLLKSQSMMTQHSESGGGTATLEEKDIAILVRDRVEAEEMQLALANHGYASVYLSNRENVFLSTEATELLLVLTGILLAEDDRMLIAALSTRLCGLDSQQLYRLQEDELFWEANRNRFLDLRKSWVRNGMMATVLTLIHDSFKPDSDRHERSLTNTLHLLELLQTASQKHRQPWELLNWLREKIESPSADSASELRLESDDNLIQIVTLHGSKGLEYPVVFIPFATRAKGTGSQKPAYYSYHDELTKAPKVYIGHDSAIQKLSEQERAAEDVRLLYVAITRAKYACYIGVTGFSDYQKSPLGLMLGLDKGDDLLSAVSNVAADTPLSAEVIDAAADANGREESPMSPSAAQCSINNTADSKAQAPSKTEGASPVTVEKMTRHIDDDWWVSSFSALTRNLKHGVMAEPDRDNGDDSASEESKHQAELRFTLKKGAATGNLLHDVLETVSFQKPEWAKALKQPLNRYGQLSEGEQQALIEWLGECLNAELSEGLSLSSLGNDQTLREVEFYFPVNNTSRQSLGAVLQYHRNTKTYPQLPDGPALKGMMHGFIDLVFEWQGRYYVADYKSTYLGDEYDDYGEHQLLQNIRDNYYDLQYLIYSLALHRYLKQRIEHYNPETHFGGVYYLYLRGMGLNQNTGVYFSKIDEHLLNRMDTLFGNKNDSDDENAIAEELSKGG